MRVCVDAELVLPTIRSAVEKQLNLISLGKANYQQVLQHTLDIFKRKFHYFVDSIPSKLTAATGAQAYSGEWLQTGQHCVNPSDTRLFKFITRIQLLYHLIQVLIIDCI